MKKWIYTLASILVILALTACGGTSAVTTSSSTNSTNTTTTISATAAPSVADALTEKNTVTENQSDYTWDSSTVTAITLDGQKISADSSAVVINGSTATITAAGTYSLSGTLTEGRIVIDTQAKEAVRLILNSANLNSVVSAPLYIVQAEDVILVLADNTTNSINDQSAKVAQDAAADTPNAAIFSMSDLTIFGAGSLSVTSANNDGIASKDGLLVTSGNITVNAGDDGLRGKDYLVIKNGSLDITSGGDAMKSDNDTDPARGYILVEDGTINIQAGGDAMYAYTSVLVSGGQFNLTTSASTSALNSGTSAKGIKGLNSITIDGGEFTINSADDAIHSNGAIIINGGIFTISTGDDGIHADATIEINGGEINIIKSYEGIESAVITINDGKISLVSSDDGLNVAGGNDSSGMQPGGRPGAMGQDNFASYTGSLFLYIHGGTIVVEADGDGIDINGAVEMTGGTLLVNGPTAQNNGALDFDSGFKITGGLVVATGSSGMAQTPGSSSTQNSLLVYFSAVQNAGTLINVQNSAGETILTYAPTKQFQSLAFSSPDLTNGNYTVYLGGSSTGTQTGSLYQGGSYTPGTQNTTFTVSSVTTQVGQGGMGGGPGGKGPRP